MADADDWTRLALYLSGEGTPEELEETRRWIEGAPERQRMADEVRAVWDESTKSSMSWNTPAARQRLMARALAREEYVPVGLIHSTPSQSRWRRWRVASMAAAAAIILAIVGSLLQSHYAGTPHTEVASEQREVRTGPGQRALLTLPDGSHITLAPGSVLRYDAKRFGTATRELALDGEGYFTVMHDARVPFLVRTARGVVRDVGTTFDVQAFAAAPLRVVVSEGIVVLHPGVSAMPAADLLNHSGSTLKKGDLARLDINGAVHVEHGIDVGRYTGWTEGNLVFDEVPLRDAIPVLERWYDIRIQLADSALADRRLVVRLKDQSTDLMLNLLAISLNLQVKRDGRVVTLSPATTLGR